MMSKEYISDVKGVRAKCLGYPCMMSWESMHNVWEVHA